MTSYISNDLMNTITNNYITIECSDYHSILVRETKITISNTVSDKS